MRLGYEFAESTATSGHRETREQIMSYASQLGFLKFSGCLFDVALPIHQLQVCITGMIVQRLINICEAIGFSGGGKTVRVSRKSVLQGDEQDWSSVQ